MDGVLELRRSRHAFLKETVTLFFLQLPESRRCFYSGARAETEIRCLFL